MSKVLFVIQRLGIGGSITSLMNMLALLNKAGNRVDLFVMEHEGIFLEQVSKYAHLLPENRRLACIICDATNLRKYGVAGLVRRSVASVKYKVEKTTTMREGLYKKCAKQLVGYDIAVAYQEGVTTEFVQYVPAKKRIAWVHTMYERFVGRKSHKDMLALYSAYKQIICVAPASADVFRHNLPELQDRVDIIPNPLNEERIKNKAAAPQSDKLTKECNLIVSVGRLSPEKQYEYAIQAAKKLLKDGLDFRWYIVGDGNERNKLDMLISEEGLSEQVILMGAMENPYSVISKADVLVISSLYEAQPMVANEALILDVPVITTNYPSAKTLIKHGHNGLICDTSVDGIYYAVKEFFSNKNLNMTLRQGAKDFNYDSQSIVNKVLDICEMSQG